MLGSMREWVRSQVPDLRFFGGGVGRGFRGWGVVAVFPTTCEPSPELAWSLLSSGWCWEAETSDKINAIAGALLGTRI
jgi:hypothetical protein